MSATRAFPLDRLLGVPEEIGFFVRTALFGLGAAAIYWFMSYEAAGTILLGAIGLSSSAIAGILWRRRPTGTPAPTADHPSRSVRGREPTDGPFGDDPGIAPNEILAPLEIGLGATLLLFAIPFGPWMALTAVVPLAAGSLAWLRAAMADERLMTELDGGTGESRERDAAAGARGGGRSGRDGAAPASHALPATPGASAEREAAPSEAPVVVRTAARVGVVAVAASLVAALLDRLPFRRITLGIVSRLVGLAVDRAASIEPGAAEPGADERDPGADDGQGSAGPAAR